MTPKSKSKRVQIIGKVETCPEGEMRILSNEKAYKLTKKEE